MMQQFWCSHATTVLDGEKIRKFGFKPSLESYRVCVGTYFWNDLDFLELLAEHWYKCKKYWAKSASYPAQDIIYAMVSCDEKYIIDLTLPKMRKALIALFQLMQEKDISKKHIVYARFLQDIELESAKLFDEINFKFKIVLAIETIPKIPDSFVTMQITDAKILVVRDGFEELIEIKDSNELLAI
ncbi:hypothetical protein [Actinobacillus porcinus]|uniref:hypothetical protein n=1 Tax=Actinobacillus porcinus TaxID=51048 RepID=UPI0023551721|nr:hypothetical protein [Actinobacillus porcinus]